MNLHKSKTAAYDTINETNSISTLSKTHDLLCIQEPWQDFYSNVKSGSWWHILYPTSRPSLPTSKAVRSVLMVNKDISMSNWQQLDIPNMNDITAVLIRGNFGTLFVVNVYNDGAHDYALDAIRKHLGTLSLTHSPDQS
ncbi:hypothetical protein L218DRAFT_975066 [Marasmius fiardii PR-910]|nr:hypothetical protein L218DRAFT_975066 [Marasmius fiardii PR-910]